MNQLRFRSAWESYRAAVIPPIAPDVQVIESRRAFYAGAEAILSLVADQTDRTTLDVTDSDMDVMQELHEELVAFFEDVVHHRA